ncbi:hypothetical protein OIU84_023700 [Salix udensis]|uniref:Chalcone/stilbene synthase N-terminal domain-containing protein n=1 Tax=Salix udensis TaxID=889485 RepID=A0AAD6KRU9_9ROSI|nr:hypothetical protein OIU84_023700 [Salix udensis]
MKFGRLNGQKVRPPSWPSEQQPLRIVLIRASTPDYYFRITNSEHKVELKEKFKRMCEKSMIKTRYMHLTEEILKENPKVCEYMAPSLDARQDMVVVEVPKLGKEAATKAIKEWGQPKSKDNPFDLSAQLAVSTCPELTIS